MESLVDAKLNLPKDEATTRCSADKEGLLLPDYVGEMVVMK